MTQPALKHSPIPSPAGDDDAPADSPVSGAAGAEPPVAVRDDWGDVRDTLTALSRIRDGDRAARKTEKRRRMRALARARRHGLTA